MSLLIKDGLIVSGEIEKNTTADIYIEDGIIKEVGKKLKYDAQQVIDAKGLAVIPGFIDISCNIVESGYENKSNISLVSKASINGGYTTVTSSPNTQPIIDNKTVIEYIYSEAKERSDINIYPFGSLTKGCLGEEIAEIGEMVLAGAIAFSDGGISISNAGLFRDILMYSKMFDATVVAMSIDMELANGGVVNSGYMSTKLGLVGIPQEAEEIMVSRNIILAKHTGARIHLTHITTEGSVDLIRDAKDEGVNITCSTCPHYFSLSEDAVDNYNTIAKVFPPLRSKRDIEAIKQGLRDGTIDAIASGHNPASITKKNTEFERAQYGISSLETAFYVGNTYMVDELFSIYDLVEKMSTNPAKILKLKNKGLIKAGYDADITLAKLNDETKVDAAAFYSKAKYSPYDGQTLDGKLVKCVIGGRIVG